METKAENFASELIERQWLSPKSFEITLTKPKSFEYLPGQCIRLIHDAVERDYSLVTAPTDPNLALCIRNIESGILSPGLSQAPVGAGFNFNGPHGYFTFRPSTRPAVFVATGTGLAPFVSMARSGVTGFTLLHGVSSTADMYYASAFQSTAKTYVRDRQIIGRVFSRPSYQLFTKEFASGTLRLLPVRSPGDDPGRNIFSG